MFRSNKIFQKQEPRLWVLFLICHFVVWSLVPLFRTNIPMDSAEAIVWGSEFTWGSNKHPTLAAWLAYGFYKIIPNPDFAMYVLSQVCILTGFVFIYKLAKVLLADDKKALLATTFLEGTIYYSICSVEFNVNVLSLAVVPALVYAFYRAVSDGRFMAWLWVGLLAGVALLTKYTNGVFLVGMGVYLVTTAIGRAHFKKSGLYAAGLVTALVVAPHIQWLAAHDFYPFSYMAMRADGAKPWYGHVTYPLAFVGAQIAACAFSVVAFFTLWFGGKDKETPQWKLAPFLVCLGIVPLGVWVILSAVFNVPLKSMWGFPLLFLVPTMLFWIFPFKVAYAEEKRGLILTYVMMAVLALSCAGTSLFHISKRANFDGRAFAADLLKEWENRYDGAVSFVGGDIWFAANLAVYLPGEQHVMIDMNPAVAPWIDEAALLRHGVIVVTHDLEAFNAYQRRYPTLTDAVQMTRMLRNATGKEKKQHVYVGFIAPTYERTTE